MMDEMHRLQGNVIHLGDAEQKRALSGTSHKTETKMTPIAASLASRLTAAWAGALARTQVVTEIRKTADGHHIVTETLDGTTYDFWHDGRSGTTISPEERSLLGELTGIVETLARYADAAPSARPAVEKKLDAQLEAFQRRLKRNEPCLRAEWPRKAD